MRLVLRGGRLVDPASKRDAPGEVLIVDGEIAAVAPKVDAAGARVIDVAGAIVAPGFVDLHSVLVDERDVDAALRGGFTTVVTVPASDSISSDRLRVIAAAPLTRNLAGDELGETDGGSPVLSQGFTPIAKASVMRRALRYSAGFDKLLMVHAEDKSLSGPGVIGFGLTATRLGLLGVPESAETSVVARDLMILEENGGRLHFSHLTTARAVELIAEAKRRGLKVSCDVTPHHLTRDTRAAEGYSLDARVWPPLRSEADVAALRKGLADGIIDAIACDHVRVDVLDREHPFESCAPGCEAFEQALPAAQKSGLSISRAIEVLSTTPARLLGLKSGLIPGVPAAITVIDSSTWSVRGSIIGARHTFPAGVVT
jgi:dihydroorotase